MKRSAGFTMVELITVLIVAGILAAVGVSRFADSNAFENRAYADQAKTIIRYAQKLAVAQNRPIFVVTNGSSFAVCADAACNGLITAPGGSNSGSTATRANCRQGSNYVASWMCEGRPANVSITGLPGSTIFFDALGRPYKGTDPVVGPSTLSAPVIISFTSAGNTNQITIWPETGYVQ
nr:type II secretion system protein [Duganella sp. sic0402]